MSKPSVVCDECSRPVMTMDLDNEVVRIESRHGGPAARHGARLPAAR